MNRETVKQLVISLAIAISVGILMTLLSAVPPLSLLYGWAQRSGLRSVWYGSVAGVISFCLILYRSKRK